MAFVFKTERPPLGFKKDQVPGPGQYQAPEPVYEENIIPFNTSGKRAISQKPTKSPGPGTYNAPVSIQGYNTQTKVFYSRLNPEVETTDEKRQSKVFKSTTKRISHSKDQEMPGPGSYQVDTSSFKKPQFSNTGLIARSAAKENDDDRRGGVPSIPSVVHAYGYTELPGRELRLNNNPLLEIQKFVGPGYYENQSTNVPKVKGAAWHKSTVEKSPDFCVTSTGSNVGPGKYKPKLRGILPLYKLKPSSCFASNSIRGSHTQGISKKKQKRMDAAKKTGLDRLQDQLNAQKENESSDDDTETPGPGYYHNTTKSTSFVQTHKPPSQQFFGSGIERFGDGFSSSSHVGPGKYDLRKDIGRKVEKSLDFKGPFLTAEKRFVEKFEEVPGPGKYDVKPQMGPNSITKPKGEFLESFGATDSRFKPLEEEVPGPGAYLQKERSDPKNASPSNSHMFSSTSKREVLQANSGDVPPPGSYEVGAYDVATKIKKAELDDPDLTPIKPPFNSSVHRFKASDNKIDEQEDDEDDDIMGNGGWNPNGMTRGDLILKIRNQPKSSSAFVSKVQRKGVPVNEKEKSYIPGPGKYNSHSPDEWITKTYNVNFTAD